MTSERVLAPPTCNFCNSPLHYRFIDLPAGADRYHKTVEKSPHVVHTYICEYCFLVQTGDHTTSCTLVTEYSTSYSPLWLHNMQDAAHGIFKRVEPTTKNFLVELIDHHVSTEQGVLHTVATLSKKDSYALIEMYGKSDRIICHNEMAYAHSINDFVAALKLLLAPEGTIIMEFPHLFQMMENEMDVREPATVFTYFSLTTVDIILKKYQLVVFDAEECIPEGCIRLSVKHQENVTRHISHNTPLLRGRERDSGMSSLEHYLTHKIKMERQIKSYEEV